jgi:hypothetical protein
MLHEDQQQRDDDGRQEALENRQPGGSNAVGDGVGNPLESRDLPVRIVFISRLLKYPPNILEWSAYLLQGRQIGHGDDERLRNGPRQADDDEDEGDNAHTK